MLTLLDIKKITGGKSLQPGQAVKVNGVSIDTRTLAEGNIYIAIKGERLDGHDFIVEAVRKGAAAVIVSRKVDCPRGVAVIKVKDTTRALGLIAAWHRRQFDIPVIAITGSSGKTTTKEMIAAVLGRRYNVLKSTKTENNQFGVPLTLLKLKLSHDIAVLELGTNRPGDIRWLAQVCRPTMAVFTNVGDAHLLGLKSRGGIFREKIQMIKFLPSDGTIVYNVDDAWLSTIPRYKQRKTLIGYGCHANADFHASHVRMSNNQRADFKVGRRTYQLKSPALHNVSNALAAISCGVLCRIQYNDIHSALARLRFSNARFEITKAGLCWLIDDTYNANPVSLASAVQTLSAMRIKGKRIAVCGDMLELGARSKVLHREAGRLFASSKTDIVLTTGRLARYTAQFLNKGAKRIKAVHCDDLKDVHLWLKRVCAPGDAILVKGSRGMRLERTVAYLKSMLH